MEPCFTCDIFSGVEQFAVQYAWDAHEGLLSSAFLVFQVFFGAWIAWTIISHVLGAPFNLRETLGRLALFVFISVMLQNGSIFREWIYEPTRELQSSLTQSLVRADMAGNIDPSFTGMLRAVEEQMFKVVEVGTALMRDGSLTNFDYYIAGFFLIVPFAFVWAIFLAFVVEGLFKVLVVTAIGPIIVIMAGFKVTRGFTMSAVRILLNGIFVVVFAGIAMGMTGFIVKSFVLDGGGVIEGGQLTVVVRDFVWSQQFFSILIVGFISILFHLKSATLASNLSGALDGPGAAAAVVTAGMMAAGGAKAASLIGARALGGATANAGKKGLSAAADRASDIVKNWGKKGSSTP